MKRILIVDDAIDVSRMLQEALRTAYPDIPVTILPSGEEALLESTRLTFDLLITDIRLPGITGLDLIRKIRVRQPHVKVIVITGLSLDSRQEKQRDEAHPDAFMRKPITVADFLEVVDPLLNGDRPAAETKPSIEPAKAVAAKEEANPQQKLLDELANVLPGEPVKPPDQVGKGSSRNVPVEQPSTSGESLSGQLSRLRGSLGALSTILIDERGHPVAEAGDLADVELENQLVAPILSSLSAGAKVSYLLGVPNGQQMPISPAVQAYRGSQLDIVAAPVGQYTLLLAFKASRSALRLALAFEEALNAQVELMAVLNEMGLHVQSAVEVSAPEMLLQEEAGVEEAKESATQEESLETLLEQDAHLEQFEALLSMNEQGQVKIEDADAFWESSEPLEKSSGETTPGMLSFEQAQKLGLFPPPADE